MSDRTVPFNGSHYVCYNRGLYEFGSLTVESLPYYGAMISSPSHYLIGTPLELEKLARLFQLAAAGRTQPLRISQLHVTQLGPDEPTTSFRESFASTRQFRAPQIQAPISATQHLSGEMSSFSLAPFILKRPWLQKALTPLAAWYGQAAGYRQLGLQYVRL